MLLGWNRSKSERGRLISGLWDKKFLDWGGRTNQERERERERENWGTKCEREKETKKWIKKNYTKLH